MMKIKISELRKIVNEEMKRKFLKEENEVSSVTGNPKISKAEVGMRHIRTIENIRKIAHDEILFSAGSVDNNLNNGPKPSKPTWILVTGVKNADEALAKLCAAGNLDAIKFRDETWPALLDENEEVEDLDELIDLTCGARFGVTFLNSDEAFDYSFNESFKVIQVL